MNIFKYLDYTNEILIFFLSLIIFIIICNLHYKKNRKSYENLFNNCYFLLIIILIHIILHEIFSNIDFENNIIILENKSLLCEEFIKTRGDMLLKIIIYLLFLILLIVSKKHLSKLNFSHEYLFVLFILIYSTNLLIYSNGFIYFLLCLEIQSFCFIFLTTQNLIKYKSYETSFKFFVVGSVSSSIFLFSTSLIYGKYGTLNPVDLYNIFNINYNYKPKWKEIIYTYLNQCDDFYPYAELKMVLMRYEQKLLDKNLDDSNDYYVYRTLIRYHLKHCHFESFIDFKKFYYTNYLRNDLYNMELKFKFDNLTIFSIVLLLVSFFIKLYIAPFHFWIIDIYKNNILVHTILISSIGYISVFYIFIKYYIFIFNFFNSMLSPYMFFIGILNLCIGSFGIISSKKIKLISAYSTIFTTGLLFIIQFSFKYLSLVNVLYYLIIYVMNNFIFLILFVPLYLMKQRIFVENLNNLTGYYKKNPIWSVYITLSLMSFTGLPGLLLFCCKLTMYTDLIDYKNLGILLFLTFLTIVFYCYLLNILINIYFKEFVPNTPFEKISYHIYLIGFVLIFLLLSTFFNESFIYDIAEIIINDIK